MVSRNLIVYITYQVCDTIIRRSTTTLPAKYAAQWLPCRQICGSIAAVSTKICGSIKRGKTPAAMECFIRSSVIVQLVLSCDL